MTNVHARAPVVTVMSQKSRMSVHSISFCHTQQAQQQNVTFPDKASNYSQLLIPKGGIATLKGACGHGYSVSRSTVSLNSTASLSSPRPLAKF